MSNFYSRRRYVPVTAEQYAARRKRHSDLLKANGPKFKVGDHVRWTQSSVGAHGIITKVSFVEPDENVTGLIPGYRYTWPGYGTVPECELVLVNPETLNDLKVKQ